MVVKCGLTNNKSHNDFTSNQPLKYTDNNSNIGNIFENKQHYLPLVLCALGPSEINVVTEHPECLHMLRHRQEQNSYFLSNLGEDTPGQQLQVRRQGTGLYHLLEPLFVKGRAKQDIIPQSGILDPSLLWRKGEGTLERKTLRVTSLPVRFSFKPNTILEEKKSSTVFLEYGVQQDFSKLVKRIWNKMLLPTCSKTGWNMWALFHCYASQSYSVLLILIN